MKTQNLRALVIACLLALASVDTAWAQSANKVAQVSSAPITIGETWRIHSKRLGEDREIRVYLPHSYADSKLSFPVIYTLDGEGTGPATASAVQFMTGYSEFPQMPEALVIAVINTDRNRDMPIPQMYGRGGEENFLAFLADELIPAIEQRYRTQPLRILVGHSQGGLFVHYALAARPKVFQWYLSMDAPLASFSEARPLMEKARTTITKDPGYRGRLVTIEGQLGWLKEWPSLIEAAPKGFYGARVEITDETHEAMAYKGIYEGLKRLFHDYTPKAKDARLPVLEAKYKALSEDYGYRVGIPQQVLLRSAARNAQQQEGAEAIKLLQRAVALYGESPATKRIKADAEAAIKKGGPDARIAEWARLPPPDVEKMKPFLGTWERRSQDGAQWSITFEVREGVVRAQHTVTPPSAPSFQLEINFVQVLEGQTLKWGVRNGRGPGVMLHTAKLVNENMLEGAQEGVGFIHTPPASSFTYKRITVGKKPAPEQESERSRKRDAWQRPGEVMDALSVKPGDRVADIGSGFGYFTFRLAARVGAEGKVYAVDISEEAINKVRQRKERENLQQVEPILSAEDDPRLPTGLDEVLIVDSYHEFRKYDQIMQAVFRALKSGGRLGIIDGEAKSGELRTTYHRLHAIPLELVREEITRNGFVFKERRPGFYDSEYGKKMYFLIFEKP